MESNNNVPQTFKHMIVHIEKALGIMKVHYPEFYVYWNRSYKYWKFQTAHMLISRHIHPYFWVPTFKTQISNAIIEMENKYDIQKSSVNDYEYFLSFITTMRRLGVI